MTNLPSIKVTETWTVRQSLAWLRWQNATRVQEYLGEAGRQQENADRLYAAPEQKAKYKDERDELIARRSLQEFMTSQDARSLLLKALQVGQLHLTRDDTVIPSIHWLAPQTRLTSDTTGWLYSAEVMALSGGKTSVDPLILKPPRPPDQTMVDAVMLTLLQTAFDAGAKLNASQAYEACRLSLKPRVVRDRQMRDAFGKVPEHLKLKRGERSKPPLVGKSGA